MLSQTIEEKDEEKLSTDGEEKAVQDTPEKRPFYHKILDHWQIGLKITELAICVMSLSLIIDPAKKAGYGSSHIHHFSLICTTFIGYMVIITVSLVGRLLGDRCPYKTSALFSLVGSGLSLAAGTVILADRTHFTNNKFFHPNMFYMDMMCASGLFSISNCLVYAIDAILTFRLQNNL